MAEEATCPSCHRTLPEDLQAQFCPYCGSLLSKEVLTAQPESSGRPDQEPVVSAGIPWEDTSGELSFLQRLTETWSESVFHPERFFRHMPAAGNAIKALLYALIFIVMGQSFQIFWQRSLLQNIEPENEFMQALVERVLETSLEAQLIMTPLIGLLTVFLATLIYHICLVLVGAARHGLQATFRVIAYSNGTMLFYVIPFLGQILGFVWGLVLMVIGFREAHSTTTGKALLAVFLPVIFCCGLMVFGMLMLSLFVAQA